MKTTTSISQRPSNGLRVMTIVGTRPEAIKVAPVIRALAESPDFQPIIAATAQHRSMLDQTLDVFGLSPDHDLDLIVPRQTLAGFAARALESLTELIEAERPDAVIVQGDTTTTFAGSLAAFYNKVPVVHLEAGLRTGDRYSPFPEELNRRLTTQLTTLHLPPTPESRANLLAEGVKAEDIVVTGNTVIDALLWVVNQQAAPPDEDMAALERDGRRILLVTAHRRESWGEGLVSVGRAVAEIARREPDLLVVLPLHKNPIVREALLPAVSGIENVTVLEPLDYRAFSWLLNRSHVVLTDSGGVQEEGPSLGKPVLVMRDTTERPEAVAAGTARLVGTDTDVIVANVEALLHDEGHYRAMAHAVNPYGDGRAAERTVAALAHHFGLGPPAVPFAPSNSGHASANATLGASHPTPAEVALSALVSADSDRYLREKVSGR
ncbi:MAG: UDP-N-acetylglucosamine 2-epimerase (non-hydrolyzing) [Acidimicrobiia bacterium]|nr:UDP-N-acetylglucosamine 2-epimerase (non-hydrolyzing) [Acidimicrobiia bacterium]